MYVRRSVVVWSILAALTIIWAPAAGAHTGFESSDPADGAVTDAPVERITLVFTGDAEPAGMGFRALDPDGAIRKPVEATTQDGRTWLLQFDPPLAGGLVGVRWRVKAPDAHPIEGAFSFMTPDLPPSPEVVEPRPEADPPGSDVSAASAGVEESATPAATSEAADVPEVEPTTTTVDDRAASGASRDGVADTAAAIDDRISLDAFLDVGTADAKGAQRLGAAGRFASLTGVFTAIGGMVFAATVLGGPRRDVRCVLVWVRRAGLVVAGGALVAFLAHVVDVDAGAWSTIGSSSAIADALGSTEGAAALLRIGGGLAIAYGIHRAIHTMAPARETTPSAEELEYAGAARGTVDAIARQQQSRTGHAAPSHDSAESFSDPAWTASDVPALAAAGSAALVAAYLFDGHTVTEGNRAITSAAAMVHVLAGAVWSGGVFMLAAVLWRRRRDQRELGARRLAVRFSVIATAALVAVGIAGVALSVIVLDSPSELWATEWGRTLLAKVTLVGIATAAGGYNHWVLVPRLDAAPGDPALDNRFRVIVTCEAVALLAVAAATALLVGAAT